MILEIFGLAGTTFATILSLVIGAVGTSVGWIANRKARNLKHVQSRLDLVEDMREDLEELNRSYADQLKINATLNERIVKLESENKELHRLIGKLEAENQMLKERLKNFTNGKS